MPRTKNTATAKSATAKSAKTAKTATAKSAKTAKTASKTAAKTVTPVVSVTPPIAPPAPPTNKIVAPVATEPTLTDAFNQMLGNLTALRQQITVISGQVRTLRARSEREMKAAVKAGRKRKNPNRKPSGFVKPALISNELANFLNKPKGTEMARTSVTKEINQYIRSNNLQDPSNGRIILADSKLSKLLKLAKGDQLTYFNLQRYMRHHFPKPQSATASSS